MPRAGVPLAVVRRRTDAQPPPRIPRPAPSHCGFPVPMPPPSTQTNLPLAALAAWHCNARRRAWHDLELGGTTEPRLDGRGTGRRFAANGWWRNASGVPGQNWSASRPQSRSPRRPIDLDADVALINPGEPTLGACRGASLDSSAKRHPEPGLPGMNHASVMGASRAAKRRVGAMRPRSVDALVVVWSDVRSRALRSLPRPRP